MRQKFQQTLLIGIYLFLFVLSCGTPDQKDGSAKTVPAVNIKGRIQIDSTYLANKEFYVHLGPYLPIVFEACQEDELAQETKIGSVSHGIFTFHFAKVLREAKSSGFVPTLEQIKDQTTKLVSAKFKYQNPRLVAPSDKLKQAFSWQMGAK